MHDEHNESDWLIEAKLEAPRQHIDVIGRDHAVALLDQVLDRRCLALVAPAGFGKTTLLTQWRGYALDRGVRVAWLTLDEQDSDPVLFLSYLIASLARADVDLGRLEMLSAHGFFDSPLHTVVTALIRRLTEYDGHVAVILDDYHRVGSRDVDFYLNSVIANAPGNLHFIIGARERPGIDLTKHLVNGQAIEVGADTLCFTFEEMKQAVGNDLPNSSLNSLFEKTEGWPVAVQLARLAFQDTDNDSFIASALLGNKGHFADYLANQIVSNLNTDLREFLKKTSILERFNASLANTVCEVEDSWRFITEMESFQSLIVPHDEKNGWYRYHHLFEEYLRDLLQREDPQTVPDLHMRASLWHESDGSMQEAVRHARLAENYDRCAQLIEEAGGWTLILWGGVGYLRALMRNVPEIELNRYPRLLLATCYALVKEGKTQRARSYFESAKRAYLAQTVTPEFKRDFEDVSILIETYQDQLWNKDFLVRIEEQSLRRGEEDKGMHLALLRTAGAVSALAIADFEYVDNYSKAAMRDFRRADSMIGLNYCYLHSGSAAMYCGRFQLARVNFWEALRLADDNFGEDSGLKSMTTVLYTTLRYWAGEVLEESDIEQFRTSLTMVQDYDGWFEIYANGLDTSVDLALAANDEDAAMDSVLRSEHVAIDRGLDRLMDIVIAHKLRLCVLTRNAKEANSLSERLAREYPIGCWRENQGAWRVYCVVAESLSSYFYPRNRPKALSYQKDLAQMAAELGLVIYSVRAMVDGAQLLDQSGQRSEALALVLNALELAAPEGIKRPFIRNSRVSSLLRAAVKEAREQALDSLTTRFLHDCLDEIAALRLAGKANSDQSLMSPRELQVLVELSEDQSNKEIARALDMTPHTVKFHLKNIFNKLGVERRASAVDEARRRKIIA